MKLLSVFAVIAALCVGAEASASARVAVLDFKGPKASKARAQFMKALCKAEKCVKPGRGGEDVEVDAAVSGRVKKVKGKFKLTIEVYSSEEDPPVTKTVALKKSGKIDAKALKGAVKAVRQTLAELDSSESDEDTLASAE